MITWRAHSTSTQSAHTGASAEQLSGAKRSAAGDALSLPQHPELDNLRADPINTY